MRALLVSQTLGNSRPSMRRVQVTRSVCGVLNMDIQEGCKARDAFTDLKVSRWCHSQKDSRQTLTASADPGRTHPPGALSYSLRLTFNGIQSWLTCRALTNPSRASIVVSGYRDRCSGRVRKIVRRYGLRRPGRHLGYVYR